MKENSIFICIKFCRGGEIIMKKLVLASLATLSLLVTPVVAFAHGGHGNSGPGNMNHMRFDDHRFDDDHRFMRRDFRDFRNFDIRNNIMVFNRVINSDNVRIRNIIRVVNRF